MGSTVGQLRSKLVISLLLLGVCFLAEQVVSSSNTAGMNCKTTNGFEYCEGKGSTYMHTETKIKPQSQNTMLTTRVQTTSGYAGGYGFRPKTQCDLYDQNRCQQLNTDIIPTFLINDRSQPRYILQIGAIQQKIRLAICTDTLCSSGRGQCTQHFATVQLLAWDPNAHNPQLFVDGFRIPSCCRCSRTGQYYPYGSHSNVGK